MKRYQLTVVIQITQHIQLHCMTRPQLGPGRNYRATRSAQQHQCRRKWDSPPSKSQGSTITAYDNPEEQLIW
ncbi:hypothetical protein NDU88_002223 [Pleurodeles waltl]|uniref:Uncharacterized protein n=1 Tax=Pleurodeles waltl TaxID=8319 RepID=A0AAV7W1K4_PLEWA|nr:hypothetical protein NDU88_002223 [Pleurodeles waltl]